jgi:tetratricopeptide (TPR) repeat protein
MARNRLPVEKALGVLSAALRPVPVPLAVPLGKDCLRLRQLAEKVVPDSEPVLGLLTLTRALWAAGDETLAERLLRDAVQARRREVVLYHSLGKLLTEQEPPRWKEAVEFYRAAGVLRPDLGVNLATALLNSGKQREGLGLLARLVKEKPDNPYLHIEQGFALEGKGDLDGAIACYQKALALDPKDVRTYTNLGAILCDAKHDLDGAIACFRKALELDPKLAQAHYNLGNALYAKGQLDEAMAEYRQAIALDPQLSPAHHNLGSAMRAKGQLDGAVAEYRKAIALDPKYVSAHTNLGTALLDTGQVDEAMAEYRQAIALDPKYVSAHTNLGITLREKGQLDEAIVECRQAIALDPKNVSAHNSLGTALLDTGQVDEAIAEYRQTIALDPREYKAHYNLGRSLREKGQLDEAIAEYRQTIAIQPKYAEAHCNLGLILLQQERLAEAVASLRRGHELGSKQPGWDYPSLLWVRTAEQLVELETKLPGVLQGKAAPAKVSDTIRLAGMCQQPLKRFAASARLYANAFAAEPKLADDLQQQHRYNAACSAALAAAGQGKDARLLPDKVVTMFRRWTLDWLRADLTAFAKLAGQNNPAVKQAIQQRLAHWRQDPDLASLRDPQALDRLPDDERAAWQALWRDVDELAKRVVPTRGSKEPSAPKAQP